MSLTQTAISFPGWLIGLARRILGLPPGFYQITLLVGTDKRPAWTLVKLGEIENG